MSEQRNLDQERYRRARRCLNYGLFFFVLSLLLPAAFMHTMGAPENVYGWQIWTFLMFAGSDVVVSLFSQPARSLPMILPCLAAYFNVNFLALSIWLYRERPSHRLPRWLAASIPCGLFLAIVSPLATFEIERLLPGFYLWILAHCFLLTAAGRVWKTGGTASPNVEES